VSRAVSRWSLSDGHAMTDRFYVGRVGVRSSEEVIDRKELEHLRMMARRGADYEAAARQMRNRHALILENYIRVPGDRWAEGWLAAIREFSTLVVRRTDR